MSAQIAWMKVRFQYTPEVVLRCLAFVVEKVEMSMSYRWFLGLSAVWLVVGCSSRSSYEVTDEPYTGDKSESSATNSASTSVARDGGTSSASPDSATDTGSSDTSTERDASDAGDPFSQAPWSVAASHAEASFMAVHGSNSNNVWIVGADDGTGPIVLHFDGQSWERKQTGVRGDLWWVHTFDDGTAFLGGADATMLRYADGQFVRQRVPGFGKDIVFGVWGYSADDMYAVGSSGGMNGFIWHWDGREWVALPTPQGLPEDQHHDIPGFFKVWGNHEGVWIVGDQGVILHGAAETGFARVAPLSEKRLFTVHGNDTRTVFVGGDNSGVLMAGTNEGALTDETPSNCLLLQGTYVTPSGVAWATGADGFMYRQPAAGQQWELVDTALATPIQSLHGMWVSPEGAVWAVGGNVLSSDLNQGALVYRGPEIPSWTWEAPAVMPPACPANQVDPAPDTSIARRWNEQLLGAIRRDVPQPTVHARNLFHTSVAIWDAWATYDDVATGYVTTEKQPLPDDLDAARQEAISYAAYRVLLHRYQRAAGGATSAVCFQAFLNKLGYDAADSSTEGDSPRAVGNRIGQAVIDAFADDGANEANAYSDPAMYAPSNPLLIVDKPGVGANIVDPTQWQRLLLVKAVTQNGIELGAGAQPYIGAHWRDVTPFGLVREQEGQTYFSDFQGPINLDDALVEAIVDVLHRSTQLDIEDGTMIDISPGAYGNNSLGTDDGAGHPVNTVTGQPYASNVVRRGDFTRVLAEFWADGPMSETPPGHWNALANSVSYSPGFERKLFGAGETVDQLTWDAHLYFALNGAVHDAAIAAWELKREYVTARPITLIRYMAEKGQRTDQDLPNYDPEGLPLIPGVLELITEETVQPGQRHAHLARYVGEVAVYSWQGEPGDRDHEIGGVGWIRALMWMPYQRRTFVTPAFPGYVSGHSTFSRAAAEVLTGLTGSEYFPDGLGEFVAPAGYLVFEAGPTAPVRLQWATYYDAADQAGQSRLWGGIHIRNDDFDGRRIGSVVGSRAIEQAKHYFNSP